MHAAASVLRLHWMLEVQHLVVHQILDGVSRRVPPVEYAAHHNGVVRGVVVAKQPLRSVLAPCEQRATHQAMKEAEIQGLENLVEIVVFALRRRDALAPTSLPDAFALPHYGFARSEPPIAMRLRRVNRLPIEFGDQDM